MSDENAEFDEELEQSPDESGESSTVEDLASADSSSKIENTDDTVSDDGAIADTDGQDTETDMAEEPVNEMQSDINGTTVDDVSSEDPILDPSSVEIPADATSEEYFEAAAEARSGTEIPDVEIAADATSSEYFEAAAEAKLGTEIPDLEIPADATSGEYFEAVAGAKAASEALESSKTHEVQDAQAVDDLTEAESIPEVPSSEDYVAATQPQVTPVTNMNSEASPMADNNQVTPAPTATQGSFEEWVINPDSDWPPPIFLKKNVTPRERFYLEYRWHSQWSFYDSKATQNKNTYYWYQRIVVIGSLLIPTLISLNSTIARFITELSNAGEGTETLVRIGVDSVTVFISLAVAGSAALESLYKYGENWSSYRAAAEELQAEKNFYDMSAGPYATDPNPFASFVARTEGIIANQNGKYFQAVQAQIQKQSEDNEAIVDNYLSGDDDDGGGEIIPSPNYTPDIG